MLNTFSEKENERRRLATAQEHGQAFLYLDKEVCGQVFGESDRLTVSVPLIGESIDGVSWRTLRNLGGANVCRDIEQLGKPGGPMKTLFLSQSLPDTYLHFFLDSGGLGGGRSLFISSLMDSTV